MNIEAIFSTPWFIYGCGVAVGWCYAKEFLPFQRNGFFAKKVKPEWEYGTAGDPRKLARRNTRDGRVQMLLWPAGKQGHTSDYWHNFDSSWWSTFLPNENGESK